MSSAEELRQNAVPSGEERTVEALAVAARHTEDTQARYRARQGIATLTGGLAESILWTDPLEYARSMLVGGWIFMTVAVMWVPGVLVDEPIRMLAFTTAETLAALGVPTPSIPFAVFPVLLYGIGSLAIGGAYYEVRRVQDGREPGEESD